MNLLTVKSAFPEFHYTQSECLQEMRQADFWQSLSEASRKLLEKVLLGDSGIGGRYFCLDDLSKAWRYNAQELNEYYEKHAPVLAAKAVEKALSDAGLQAGEVDALFLSTCTGYLCPGVTSYVAEQLGMREDVFLQDMTGLGCGAAVPLMRAASGVVAADSDTIVLTVSVEVCSAAFHVENDVGVLVSTCIFGDGAAAAVWSGSGGSWSVSDFQSIHVPSDREKIRFTNSEGRLRNQLAREVPELAAQTVARLYALRKSEPGAWITHGGGRDVIEQLEKVLPVENLSYARHVMQHYGNLSSPSVLVALEKFLGDDDGSARHLWMCAFGAGFSAHSCELERVD